MNPYRPWSQLNEPERVAVRQAFPDFVWAALTFQCLDGRWLYRDPR